jgi:hypothetical protein
MNTFAPRTPAELDAEALADMLNEPPHAWTPIDEWLSAHAHVSATYVQQQYREARLRVRAATLFPAAGARPRPRPAPAPAPSLTDSEQAEAALAAYLSTGLSATDTIRSLAKDFDLSAAYVRSELHTHHLRAPETLGTRFKRTES